jgi:hypothetical protein
MTVTSATGQRSKQQLIASAHDLPNSKQSYRKSRKLDNEPSPVFLDQFSTSPTGLCFSLSEMPKICANNAPYFAYSVTAKKWAITQGCCNDWNCPRCGQMRARHEYGRIVEGVRSLARHNIIYFMTITCRGKELSKSRAENGYAEWTESFLDACYTRCKRSGYQWDYVHVTERQKRGHPHGHILTTFCPLDLRDGYVEKWEKDNGGRLVKKNVPALRSPWMAEQVIRSGLGKEYDISFVGSVEGASRYVAKYLFKDTIFSDKWPKGWKRIRYSQSFPKLPERKSDAIVLISASDWDDLARRAVIVKTNNLADYNTAQHWLRGHDTIVSLNTVD